MVDTTPHGTGEYTDVLNEKYDPDSDGVVENIELDPLANSGEQVAFGDNSNYHVMHDGEGDTLIVTHVGTGNMWRFGSDGTLSVPSAPVDNTDVARLAELAEKADTGHNHDSRYYTESEVDNKFQEQEIEQGITNTLRQVTVPYGESAIIGTIQIDGGNTANLVQASLFTENPASYADSGIDLITYEGSSVHEVLISHDGVSAHMSDALNTTYTHPYGYSATLQFRVDNGEFNSGTSDNTSTTVTGGVKYYVN